MSDVRATQAREHNRLARAARTTATQHREMRDELVRQMRAEDPRRWTYRAIGAAVGITPELAAVIITGRRPRNNQERADS